MNRYRSGAIGLYAVAVLAQALTWADLGGTERGTRVVLFLLVAALLTALLGPGSRRN